MKITSWTGMYRVLAISAVLVLCSVASYTRAQTAAENSVPGDKRIQISEQVRARIINLSENIIDREKATVSRLENIMNRLDTRIIKLRSQGVDVTLAQEKLNEAKSALGTANDRMAETSTIARILDNDNPRRAFAEVRNTLRSVHKDLQSAHIGLLDTVNLLKEAIATAGLDRGVSGAVTNDPKASE